MAHGGISKCSYFYQIDCFDLRAIEEVEVAIANVLGVPSHTKARELGS